jgi:hypothetical protein
LYSIKLKVVLEMDVERDWQLEFNVPLSTGKLSGETRTSRGWVIVGDVSEWSVGRN